MLTIYSNTEFALEGERMESKVLRLLRYAVQPSAEDISVDWGSWTPHLNGVSPTEPPPLFNGHLQHIYGILKKDSLKDLDFSPQQSQAPVVVRLRMPPHPEIQEFTIPLSATHTDPSQVIVKLAARSRIRQLQNTIDDADVLQSSRRSTVTPINKDQLKAEIIELSTKYVFPFLFILKSSKVSPLSFL